MKSQPLQQPTRAARPANVRRWQWLGLGLIATVAALAISFYATSARDPQAQPSQPLLVQPEAIDPARLLASACGKERSDVHRCLPKVARHRSLCDAERQVTLE
jgi:hypothetical protein